NASSYQWDFGDGGSSTEENPSYTYYYPGTYTVMLKAFCPQGQNDIAVKQNTIVVHENAIAFFGHAPETVIGANQAVEFYNFSDNSNTWNWDFGDGSNSTEENPEHYYYTAGTYTVTLIANNDWNCPDTFSILNAVTSEESGEIVFPNAFTPDPSGGNGGLYDPQAIDNNIFFPVHAGVTDYHLMIFNRWGELIFESFDVKIGWDGYYRDMLCQQDVYVWKVSGRYIDGKEFTEAGDVTLLR
ncbi:MAG: PKD domain-containing protein, partial [Flavobacteriales bacterium]